MPTIPLANATLRFVAVTDGRGEGFGGLDLGVVDQARLRAAAVQHGCLVDHGDGSEHVLIGGMRMYV